MVFCEKLDFLMKITGTTNSLLARQLALDPSFISRLRRGQRGPAKGDAYTTGMARYFAKHCAQDYQRKALCDALKISEPFDESELGSRIFQWLTDAQPPGYKNIDRFLDRLTGKPPARPPIWADVPQLKESSLFDRSTSIYYGVEGKPEAVVHFLSAVAALGKPITLLLFSDEPTDWMTSDPVFTAKWASLMFAVLAKGNRIRIVHTVSRDLDEMLNAISQWMPLYMTGLIEPYYYPRKRDGIFKRTLFIAPGTAAVLSTSVGGMCAEAANFLIRDARAILAIEQEHHSYLNLCSPLMRIMTADAQDAYLNTLREFENELADTLLKTESLSLLTMPEAVVASIGGRVGRLRDDFFAYHQSRTSLFLKNIRKKSYTEIIHLPDPQAVRDGRTVVAFSDILHGGTVYYTTGEFILHLENIVSMLKKYENIHVCLVSGETDTRYMVYAKRDVGVIVAKTSSPPIILAINEKNMTAAFWDYLTHMAGDKAYSSPNNRKIAKTLSDYIRLLKS